MVIGFWHFLTHPHTWQILKHLETTFQNSSYVLNKVRAIIMSSPYHLHLVTLDSAFMRKIPMHTHPPDKGSSCSKSQAKWLFHCPHRGWRAYLLLEPIRPLSARISYLEADHIGPENSGARPNHRCWNTTILQPLQAENRSCSGPPVSPESLKSDPSSVQHHYCRGNPQ